MNEKLVPEANIGMVGHVAHGKTTLTEALTGKLTLTHSEELKRGITIRLGYADVTIYKDSNNHFFNSPKCPICFSDGEILRTVSFIDVPGHETLMATVLTGASLMDGAVLVISATEKCPQPQTREHLTALEVVGIKNVVIVQNKIDLVSPERARESYKEIKSFIKGSVIEDAPIIPVSAQQRVNIDAVFATIEEKIPTPKRDESKTAKLLVARSFDINRPGTKIKDLTGGIIGGSVIQGTLRLGEEIEIEPGTRVGDKYLSLASKIVGLKKGKFELEEAGAGGLIGVMTELDPFLTKSDSLVGNVVSPRGQLPPLHNKLNLQLHLLKRAVGTEDFSDIKPLKIGENLLINVGTARSLGNVLSVKKDSVDIELKIPVVVDQDERVVVSRQIAGRWRLIGYGTLV